MSDPWAATLPLRVSQTCAGLRLRKGVRVAAEASLRRLRTDRIDLYVLHWPGRYPLGETYEAFELLVEQRFAGEGGLAVQGLP